MDKIKKFHRHNQSFSLKKITAKEHRVITFAPSSNKISKRILIPNTISRFGISSNWEVLDSDDVK